MELSDLKGLFSLLGNAVCPTCGQPAPQPPPPESLLSRLNTKPPPPQPPQLNPDGTPKVGPQMIIGRRG